MRVTVTEEAAYTVSEEWGDAEMVEFSDHLAALMSVKSRTEVNWGNLAVTW